MAVKVEMAPNGEENKTGRETETEQNKTEVERNEEIAR